MESMCEKDWITLFVHQSDLVMTLWTVYVAVVALIIGFVAQKEQLNGIRWVLVAAMSLFALVNGVPLVRAQMTLVEIHERLSCDAYLMLSVTPALIVALVHVVMDAIVVLFLIGWGRWFSRRSHTAPRDSHW